MPSHSEQSSSKKKRAALDKYEGMLIESQFRIGKQIGAGSYGQVRIGFDTKSKKAVAIKFEGIDSDSQLKSEYEIYSLIQDRAECKKGFPHAYFFGRYNNYQILIMELLGQNLETVFDNCGRRFSLKTLIFVTLQLLKRFETLHSLNIVFRDVKPENFVLGSETNTIYVIDFGLSKFFVDSNGKHLPYQVTNEYIGTARYMSINAHNCREQGRRDDLEALGYVFVYFIRNGKLPWSGVRVPTFKEHNKVVLTMKKTIPEEDLCAGAPEEFLFYMKYVRFLEFDAAPCYMRLRNTFKRLFQRHNFQDNGTYDWNLITGKQGAAIPHTKKEQASVPLSTSDSNTTT